MKRLIYVIGAALLAAASATGAMAAYGDPVFTNSQYATAAGAGDFYVVDQVINLWKDDDPPDGIPEVAGTQHNVNVTVTQGPDQNWSGQAVIQPGAISYSNFIGAPDQDTSGWGGAASGGTLIIKFAHDIVNGSTDVIYEGTNYGPIDFMVHGFGFCFNKAFSSERGTVKIYAATAAYNPTFSGPDINGPGPLGEVTVTGDESQWRLISTWEGWGDWDNDPSTPDTWKGNPDHDYTSGPGAYGPYIWGDLSDAEGGGLTSARYLKFVLGDGSRYQDGSNPVNPEEWHNTGRALFVDAVEARVDPDAMTAVPAVSFPVGLLSAGLLGLMGLMGLRRRA